jgi:hypothetical protein
MSFTSIFAHDVTHDTFPNLTAMLGKTKTNNSTQKVPSKTAFTLLRIDLKTAQKNKVFEQINRWLAH